MTADLFPTPRARHRIFGGLNERQELIFHWIAVVVVLLYVTGWIGADHEPLRDVAELGLLLELETALAE